jgi:hypothetical protein
VRLDRPCSEVRELLEACHDGELSIDERIDVQSHVRECAGCSAAAADIAMVSVGMHDLASHIAEHDTTDATQISRTVLERIRVEELFSMRAQIADWFSDMHLVWAGLGASVATLICVIGSASVLHATSQDRPNSMARVLSVLASPGSNDNPIRLNYGMSAPRPVTDVAIETWEEDGQYALSAVVSREGRVQGVEVLNQANRPGVNAMLNEAYRMRFAPATSDRGDAVAVSMVWLVANTTVKGRPDETMKALREALRLQTVPQPISTPPVPADIIVPSPQPVVPPVKPAVPDAASSSAAAMALAAAGF